MTVEIETITTTEETVTSPDTDARSRSVVREESFDDGKVIKKVLREGSEEVAPDSNQIYEVSVHYVGRLLSNKKEFDSSRTRGQPFKFSLGQGAVIKGWDVGVASMKKGELALLEIKSDYGYGASGSPPSIPPNADLEFEVEVMGSDKKRKDAFQMSTEEKIAEAKSLKDEANVAFAKTDYAAAAELYKQGIEYLKNYDSWSESEQDVAKHVNIALNLNLAQSYLKVESHLEAILACTAVLAIDNSNVKALYRRALARREFGEIPEAIKDLEIALQLEPSNTLIQHELAKTNVAMREKTKRERKMFSHIFSKGGIYAPEGGKTTTSNATAQNEDDDTELPPLEENNTE